jgi:hypothetical protein
MSNALAYLWRHPRRTGFITLNVIVLLAFVVWGGIGGLPNVMLGYTGLALLAAVWVAAWLAWAWMIAAHQLRRRS